MTHEPRTHGAPAFSAVLLRGGPGAPRVLAPLARALTPRRGILEGSGTACTVAGQLAALPREVTAPADFLRLVGSDL
ncbi:MAG: hypothetical protein HY814_08980 [Candidatus Riflebacteria bacterium]|nr:hypothetical protein [Candidatus Riflebacteria bacterium]